MKTVYVQAIIGKIDTVTSANMRTNDVQKLIARLEKETGANIKASDKLEGMEFYSFSSFVSAFHYWNSPNWKSFEEDENGNKFNVYSAKFAA